MLLVGYFALKVNVNRLVLYTYLGRAETEKLLEADKWYIKGTISDQIYF
jgi:hypothetical protein